MTELLSDLSLEPLNVQHRVSRFTFLYVLNEHVAMPPDKIDLVLCQRPVRGLSTKQKFVIPRSQSTQYQESFVPRTISEWNSLPDTVTSAGSVYLHLEFEASYPGVLNSTRALSIAVISCIGVK